MNTITRVYELLDDRALSLTKLAEMSGVAYSTIKMAESRTVGIFPERMRSEKRFPAPTEGS